MNLDRSGDASFDDCEHVLERVYEFLDNELDVASSDAIRHHLAMCEPCLDRFDAEEAVKSLVHRCCGGDCHACSGKRRGSLHHRFHQWNWNESFVCVSR